MQIWSDDLTWTVEARAEKKSVVMIESNPNYCPFSVGNSNRKFWNYITRCYRCLIGILLSVQRYHK